MLISNIFYVTLKKNIVKNNVEIAQRLEMFILKNFKNKTEFCKKADMSLQTLKKYTSVQTGIGNKTLAKLTELGCVIQIGF